MISEGEERDENESDEGSCEGRQKERERGRERGRRRGGRLSILLYLSEPRRETTVVGYQRFDSIQSRWACTIRAGPPTRAMRRDAAGGEGSGEGEGRERGRGGGGWGGKGAAGLRD
eukprot:762961-Hanusia_phi.AAC.17